MPVTHTHMSALHTQQTGTVAPPLVPPRNIKMLSSLHVTLPVSHLSLPASCCQLQSQLHCWIVRNQLLTLIILCRPSTANLAGRLATFMGGTTRLLLPRHHYCSTSCPQLVLESLQRIIYVTCSAAFYMDFEVRGPGIALKLILLWISAPWYALTHVPQACLSECCPQQGLATLSSVS